MTRVLILDDREDYLRALRSALRGQFDVLTVSSLPAAKKLMDETIDVALVDVRLSETDFSNRDGVRFLEWVKKVHPGIPVLLMSAYQDVDANAEGFSLGADYFLRKPIDLRELKELLRGFGEKGAQLDKTPELCRRKSGEPR